MSKKPNNPSSGRDVDQVPILESVVVPSRDARGAVKKPPNTATNTAVTAAVRPVPNAPGVVAPALAPSAEINAEAPLSPDQIRLAERILDAIQEELPNIIREEVQRETNEILTKLEQALMGDELPQVINRVMQPEINALYAELQTVTRGIESRVSETIDERLDPLEKEAATLKIDIAHLKDQSTAKFEQFNQMLSRLSNDHSVLADAQQELVENQQTLRENYSSLLKKFDGVATTQGQLAQAQGTYSEKLDKLNQQHQAFAQGLEKWRTEIEQKLSPIDSRMTELTRDLSASVAKDELAQALSEIKGQIALAADSAGASKDVVQNIADSTREIEQKLSHEMREATSELAAKLARASQDLAQLVTDNLAPLDTVTERLASLQQDVNTVKNDLADAREKLTRAPNPDDVANVVRKDREQLLHDMEERFDRAYLRRVSALPKLVVNITRSVTEHELANSVQTPSDVPILKELARTPPTIKKKPS